MSAPVLALPTSLILLVHLHLLEYPRANNPEYDHNMFDTKSRGLRERAKTMEDVAYFLVSKIEGKGVKSILSSYPCAQPSESLAFRTSLSKYLENLRHRCIYPTPQGSGNKSSSRDSKGDPATFAAAIWWKDVVVRKSLLEECSGDRFERLLLSLSTHALMTTSRIIPFGDLIKSLSSYPIIYTKALARYQAIRHAWSKSASILVKSENDLKALRESLLVNIPPSSRSRFVSLSTERLKALAESKLDELFQQRWTEESGRTALLFFFGLAGLRTNFSQTVTSFTLPKVDVHSKPAPTPSPLPIAAAHHPSYLKRLRRSIFQSKTSSKDGITPLPSKSHAEIILAEPLDAEKRIRRTLSEALHTAKMVGLDQGKKIFARMSVDKPVADAQRDVFWISKSEPWSVNLQPEVNRDLLESLGLESEHDFLDVEGINEDVIEKKIEKIRTSILPPFPPPLDLRDFAPVEDPKCIKTSKHFSKPTQSKAELPITPSLLVPKQESNKATLLSPSKSSRSIRRQSVRFSMARKRSERPSIFHTFSDSIDDDINKLVDDTHDFPTDDEETEDIANHKTPRARTRSPIKRIWTAGTPKAKISAMQSFNETPKPRKSTALAKLFEDEPSLGSLSPSSEGILHEQDDPMSSGGEGEDPLDDEAEDVFDDDPPSMTLKDILLSAGDGSQIALLDEGSDDIDGEQIMLFEDTSFEWQ